MTSTERPSLWGTRTEKRAAERATTLESLAAEVRTLRADLAAVRDLLPPTPLPGSPASRREQAERNERARTELANSPSVLRAAAEQRALEQRLRNPYGLLDREYEALPDTLRLPLEAQRQQAEQGNPAALQRWGWTVAGHPPREVRAALIAAGVWPESAR